MVFVGKGQKEIKRDWPVVTGLEAIDKHEGRPRYLVTLGFLGVKTTITKRSKVGLG